MAAHSEDWLKGYQAGRDNVSVAEGKCADWVSGWLIGHRDRRDDEEMEELRELIGEPGL